MKRAILCFLKSTRDLVEFEAEQDWEFCFVPNSQNAFQALSDRIFEAVVADVAARTETGTDFLTAVKCRFPNVTRVALFDPANRQIVLTSNGVADQCLPKPCTGEVLISAVQRARLLQNWLVVTPALKQLLPQMRKLPSVPAVYFRLVKALQSPDASLEDIGRIMSNDLVMTAKLLQLVNSPFFGVPRTVTNPGEAISHLGMDRTKSLVLMAHAFSNYQEDKSSGFSLEQLWRHSMSTAHFARRITRYETGHGGMAEAAFTAGLLHDAGKLMLAANCPQQYHQVFTHAREKQVSFVQAEREVLGTTHAEIGACVFANWGLPADILEAIAFHHCPDRHSSNTFSPLTAVHAANVIELQIGSQKLELEPCRIDEEYLARLGLEKRAAVWLKECADGAEKAAA